MMKLVFTFLLFVSLLNDIFEFNCEDAFALTCSTARVPTISVPFVPLDLIFIKSVEFPETFMRTAWFLLSFLTAVPTVNSVAMTIIFALTALLTLTLNYLALRINKHAKDVISFDELIPMKPIEQANVPHSVITTVTTDLPYTVYLGSLFSEPKAQSQVLGYNEVYLGNLFRESDVKTSLDVLSYDVYLGDLFLEEIQVPLKAINSSDTRIKARNPNVLGYADVYLGDLFHEGPDEPIITSPNEYIPVRKYSFLSIKAKKAQQLLEDFALNDSFGSMTDLFTVEALCEKDQEEAIDDHEDIPMFTNTLAASPSILETAASKDPEVTVPAGVDLPRKLSYADAVGYDHMEVKRPRNLEVIGYDVDLSLLFPEEAVESKLVVPFDKHTLTAVDRVPVKILTRRMSYAEAVITGITGNLSDLFSQSNEPAEIQSEQDIPYRAINVKLDDKQKKASHPSKSNTIAFDVDFIWDLKLRFAYHDEYIWSETIYD